MDERTDESLMSAVCQGDKQAFEALVQRHINPLYNYAYRLLRSATGADDLVQETWLAVWRQAKTFKPGKVKLSTWLHRILHNKFIDELRRNRLVLDDNSVNAAVDEHTPAADAERLHRLQRLQQEIALLPENQRAALLLSHNQGMSNKDIAVVLGQSVRAVESLLARARRTLKAKMSEHLGAAV